jgi:uncharacterized protein YbbC (DUF1343 family)
MSNFAAIFFSFLLVLSCANTKEEQLKEIVPAANRLNSYLQQLENKNIALTVNHTSMVGKRHLVDTLLDLGINISTIMSPEHGYRGTADAGELIENQSTDKIPIVSLYGKNKKPQVDQLKDIDLMVFDMQDVGTRFYTYISTMHYIMEACAENNIEVLILDRPNPNSQIDGPVLDTAYRSFVGMHSIPVLHGMTVGELALMINAEGWLKNGITCKLKIIPVGNYKHQATYKLPVQPSPNLPNQQAVNWYPSLCFFEGTTMSIGRGTDFPFQVVGHPSYSDTTFSFLPISRNGAKYPKHQDQVCYGIDLRKVQAPKQIDLQLLIEMYENSDKNTFFNAYFNTLAGTDELRNQIVAGWTVEEIRAGWQPKLDAFKAKRKQYLLYD